MLPLVSEASGLRRQGVGEQGEGRPTMLVWGLEAWMRLLLSVSFSVAMYLLLALPLNLHFSAPRTVRSVLFTPPCVSLIGAQDKADTLS